jgi:hypothetical protein
MVRLVEQEMIVNNGIILPKYFLDPGGATTPVRGQDQRPYEALEAEPDGH